MEIPAPDASMNMSLLLNQRLFFEKFWIQGGVARDQTRVLGTMGAKMITKIIPGKFSPGNFNLKHFRIQNSFQSCLSVILKIQIYSRVWPKGSLFTNWTVQRRARTETATRWVQRRVGSQRVVRKPGAEPGSLGVRVQRSQGSLSGGL